VNLGWTMLVFTMCATVAMAVLLHRQRGRAAQTR
jgi:hypothetical protein